MQPDELGEARDRDRWIRSQIDALSVELTPHGKFELAMRLMMEGARELARDPRRALPAVSYRPIAVRAELPPQGEPGSSERDGADGGELTDTAAGAAGIVTENEKEHDDREENPRR